MWFHDGYSALESRCFCNQSGDSEAAQWVLEQNFTQTIKITYAIMQFSSNQAAQPVLNTFLDLTDI